MAFAVPDDLLPVVVPTVAYWIVSGIYELVISLGFVENYRLFTTEEEDKKNLVTRSQVLVGVFVYQATQMSLVSLLYLGSGGGEASAKAAAPSPSLLQTAWQLVVASVITDGWQYSWHRLVHMNKFLYKHLHSMHHRLIVPYTYGAQYFHPLDAFFGDILGGAAATLVTGMPPRTSAVFFTLLTLKGVDDHCGLWFPNHPIHRFLTNNSAFHALHHQHEGVKYNFSGYYTCYWDKLFSTYLPYSVQEKKSGGYQLRAVKDKVRTASQSAAVRSELQKQT